MKLSELNLKIDFTKHYAFKNKIICFAVSGKSYIIKNSYDQIGEDCEVFPITEDEKCFASELLLSDRFEIKLVPSAEKTRTFGVWDKKYPGTAGYLGCIKWDGESVGYAFYSTYMPLLPTQCIRMILQTIDGASLGLYEYENPF